MQLLSREIIGQESMLGTSVIRGIVWLVQQSEDVYLTVNGVEMCQHVSHVYCFV